jgi:hypothetical protein
VGTKVAALLIQQQLVQPSLNVDSSTFVSKAQLLCHLCHCLLQHQLPAAANADAGSIDLLAVPATAQQQQWQSQ